MDGNRRIASAGLVALLALALAACGDGGGGGDVTPDVAEGTVTGRILDDRGQPVVGAIVAIGDRQGVTDANGDFTITGVTAGARTLTVTLDGYTFPAPLVQVTPGQEIEANVVGRRVSDPPTVTAVSDQTRLSFLGGAVTVTASASDPEADPLTLWGTWAGGTFDLTDEGGGRYTATVNIPSNGGLAAAVYDLVVHVSDGINQVSAAAQVTVDPLLSPGGGGPGSPGI